MATAPRRLPLDERARLIERAAHQAAQDTPKAPPVRESSTPSLLGLVADEPDRVERLCSMVYQARSTARMRTADE
jgi:hypothetical protein